MHLKKKNNINLPWLVLTVQRLVSGPNIKLHSLPVKLYWIIIIKKILRAAFLAFSGTFYWPSVEFLKWRNSFAGEAHEMVMKWMKLVAFFHDDHICYIHSICLHKSMHHLLCWPPVSFTGQSSMIIYDNGVTVAQTIHKLN